jgi:hypothetical protein
LVRKHGHLLLGREDHVDVCGSGDTQEAIEPDQGRCAEGGDPVQGADVAGEPGQADRVGDRRRDVVSQMVEPGGHLPGCEAGAFGQQDPHPS